MDLTFAICPSISRERQGHMASEEQTGRHPLPRGSRASTKRAYSCSLSREKKKESVLWLLFWQPPKKLGNVRPVLDLQEQCKDHSKCLLIRSGQAGWLVQNDKLERHFHVFVGCGHRKFKHLPPGVDLRSKASYLADALSKIFQSVSSQGESYWGSRKIILCRRPHHWWPILYG